MPIQASAGKEAAGAVVAGDLQTGRHQLSPLSGCARLPFGDAQMLLEGELCRVGVGSTVDAQLLLLQLQAASSHCPATRCSAPSLLLCALRD